MTKKTTNIILLMLIAAAAIIGAILYPSLPDKVASHWNAAGEADGTMSKFWGVFLLPMIMAGLFLLYLIIPRVDPLRANIESFRKHYNIFWVFMFAFFIYIFGLTMVWNLGHRFNFTMTIIPAMSALLYAIGFIIEKSKRNWFVGIRTPWTLSSDIVWEKTHKLGGKLFKVAAVLSLFGLFLRGESAIVATLIVPVMAVSVITIVYSYLEFRRQNK